MNKLFGMMSVICLTMVMTFATAVDSHAKKRIVFGGGPAGGTFQVVANAIQVYDPVKEMADFTVKAQSSAGSVENLRKVNSGKSDLLSSIPAMSILAPTAE